MSHRITTFPYGSFMDREVLRRLNILADASDPAMLPGFRIELRPRVNLYRSDRDVVYGAVMELTHADLARLYGFDRDELLARGVTVPPGEETVYQPDPVIVALQHGSWCPALCYMAETQVPASDACGG